MDWLLITSNFNVLSFLDSMTAEDQEDYENVHGLKKQGDT